MGEDLKNFLKNALFKAIINRKKNLLIHGKEEEDDDEDI